MVLECKYWSDMRIFQILYLNYQKVGNPKKVGKVASLIMLYPVVRGQFSKKYEIT